MPVFTITVNLEQTMHTDFCVSIEAETQEEALEWTGKNFMDLRELGHGDEEQDGPTRLLAVNAEEAEEGDEADYHTKKTALRQYREWLLKDR